MYFAKAVKVSALLLTITAWVSNPAAGSIVPRKSESEQDELAIVFYEGNDLTGTSFVPRDVLPSTCMTLSTRLRDRAQSVTYTADYTCLFFQFVDCEGTGIVFPDPASPDQNTTFTPPLFQGVDSVFCGKDVDPQT